MPVDPSTLRSVPLLSKLDDASLKRVAAAMKERSVAPGKEVVTEGSGGIAFFVILEGEADVEIRGEVRHSLGPGDAFGEMALFDADPPRSATIRATSDMRVAYLARWEFKPFVLENPEVAWSLLQALAERVVAAEDRAASAGG
jgi:cAMP-dependent protein kinase regulator